MVDRMEDQRVDRLGDRLVVRMEGRSGDRKADHSEAQRAGRMEGHSEDRKGGHSEARMEGHLEDLMVVWEPPWAGRVVGMMLVVPGWFLSPPTLASTV